MIYLMRHGLDDERFVGGWSDVDLIQEGVVQVKASTKFILENNLKIKKIISSDIKRASTTAEIVNEQLNLEIRYTDILRELNKGDLTGKEKSVLEKCNTKEINFCYPNGESMLEFYKRINTFLKQLMYGMQYLIWQSLQKMEMSII